MDFKEDLSDSTFDFARVVWPVIKKRIGGGEFVPVNNVTKLAFSQQLDKLAGVNAWQVNNNVGIRGIDIRVQYGHPYASFTICSSCPSGSFAEFEKIVYALQHKNEGWVTPAYTIRAYLDERKTGKLLYVCMIKTNALISYVNNGKPGQDWELRDNKRDNNKFIVVWCKDLKDANVDLFEYIAPGISIDYPSLKTTSYTRDKEDR